MSTHYLFHSKLTISEIAHELSFSEPNHLMRFFKAQTGMTTGEFLQDNAREIPEASIHKKDPFEL